MESFTVGPPFPRVSPLPLPHREDCWTEDATLTLLDAWGEYYLVLNRGILRKEHWQEVANTVNNRNGHDGKLVRSGIQCKNRIDTLKKRYKNEKARVSDTGDYIGTWPYFHQLDSLIWDQFLANEFSPPASTHNVRKTRSQKLPAWTNVPVGRRSKTQKRPRLMLAPVLDKSPDRNDAATVAAGNRKNAAATVAAGYRKKAAATVAAVADSDKDSNGSVRRNGSEKRKRGKEIVEALEKFGEIYERVELEKQNLMVEMEKQRMQFIRDLEFQRMQLLFEMQVQMQHNNRP